MPKQYNHLARVPSITDLGKPEAMERFYSQGAVPRVSVVSGNQEGEGSGSFEWPVSDEEEEEEEDMGSDVFVQEGVASGNEVGDPVCL